ncbi:MAG: HEAT repeat domain-containing protein [Planctomycetota bacterium]
MNMRKRYSSEGDVPWLRDMVEGELLDLFSEDESAARAAVRRLVREAREDDRLEAQLIELVETSLELHNDDTSATVCAVLVLGEIRSEGAVDVLLRGLAAEDEEEIQEAAGIALLRIGAPAVRALIERLEDEGSPGLRLPGYELLGSVGVLEDAALTRAARDCLESRLEIERRRPSTRGALESLFLAVAHLGDRRQIENLRRINAEDYRGRNPALTDALEMLEENTSGEAIRPSSPPWEERYGWLFEDERERARVQRPGAPRAAPAAESEEAGDEAEEKARRDLEVLYWGLNLEASDEDEVPDGGDAGGSGSDLR